MPEIGHEFGFFTTVPALLPGGAPPRQSKISDACSTAVLRRYYSSQRSPSWTKFSGLILAALRPAEVVGFLVLDFYFWTSSLSFAYRDERCRMSTIL